MVFKKIIKSIIINNKYLQNISTSAQSDQEAETIEETAEEVEEAEIIDLTAMSPVIADVSLNLY